MKLVSRLIAVLVLGALLIPVPVVAQESASLDPVVVAHRFALPADADLGANAQTLVVDVPSDPPPDLDADPNLVLTALTGRSASFPAEAWDIAALAATFDGDPERAFEFVRDSIGFDPYRGVLRGAAGTLVARAGSAADRALLLRALLDEIRATTRFAFADLDEAAAASLMARSFEAPPEPIGGPSALDALDAQLLDSVAGRARRDHALLRTALESVADEIGSAPEQDVIGDVAHHTWVQLEREGQWLDLDPSLPDAQAGTTLAPAASTADAIPAEERASVVVRVVAENLIDGAVEARVSLEQTLDAADAASVQVLLYFRPETGGGLIGEVGVPTAYEPALWVDGTSSVGTPIQVLPSDDGFFGSGSEVRLTRLALEFEVIAPGRERISSERALLDRVAATVRAAGGWTADDLAPMPVVDDRPAVMTSVHHLMVSTGGSDPIGAIEASIGSVFVAARLAKDEPSADLPLGVMLLPLTSSDTQLVLASEHAIVAGLDASVDTRTFVGTPRLFLVSLGPDPADPEGIEITTDLAVDGVDIAGTSETDPRSSPAQQLWYGAAETALETEFIIRVGRALDPGGRHLEAVSLAMGEPLTVITEASQVSGASETLLADISDGTIAVVPGDAQTARTWWTIARLDGETRSILDPGIRAGVIGGFPGGLPPIWGGDWDAAGNWVDWYEKTVIRRRCGGNESTVVTQCAVAPTTRQIAKLYAKMMRDYAKLLLIPPL